MILTVQQLLTDAMSLIGATAIDETPTDSELQLGLRTANMMLSRWQSMPGMLRGQSIVTFTTTSGKKSYTIGEYSADILSCKPIQIFAATVTDSANVNYPLDLVDKTWIDQLKDSNIANSRPNMIAYAPMGSQQDPLYGTFYLYNIPDKEYTITVTCSRDVNSFDNLSDELDFEPCYYEALKYGIAVRLFRHYHAVNVPVPQDLLSNERSANSTLYTLNNRKITSTLDIPIRGGRYNAYTDRGV